jgi:hypothetical protein
MKKRIVAGIAVLAVRAFSAVGATITVPGTADPWLAGMPDGSRASRTDLAPAQSPVPVPGLSLPPGTALTFNVSGKVSRGPDHPLFLPDGEAVFAHETGAENGIATLSAPVASLIGVFLDAARPSLSPAPAGLNFSTIESTNYTMLQPMLKQPFFIGDGRTSTGSTQLVVVPVVATRLFLGAMDGVEWTNNSGIFTVEVQETNVPDGVILEQPKDVTVEGGQTATFAVVVSGQGPFLYQWFFGNTRLPGETNATLIIQNVTIAAAGDYSVMVRNSSGDSVSSRAARLSVVVPSESLVEFSFDEGEGTAITSTDGKLVGSFVGSPVFSSDSPSGLKGDFSLQFAAGQRVEVPDPGKVLSLDTNNPSFTIEAWMKFVTPTNRSVFFFTTTVRVAQCLPPCLGTELHL